MDGIDWSQTDRGLGLVGGVAGLAASLFLLFGPVVTVSRIDSDGARTTTTLSGIDYLFGVPDAQFALFAWPVLLGAVTIVGTVAAWRRHWRWSLAVSLTLAAFVVVGILSIGMLYGPAAVLLLLSAIFGREN